MIYSAQGMAQGQLIDTQTIHQRPQSVSQSCKSGNQIKMSKMWNVIVWKIAAWKSEKFIASKNIHCLGAQRLILRWQMYTICDSYRSRQIFTKSNAWGKYCQPKAVEMRHNIKIYTITQVVTTHLVALFTTSDLLHRQWTILNLLISQNLCEI